VHKDWCAQGGRERGLNAAAHRWLREPDRAQPSLVAIVLLSIGQARMQLGAATQSAMHLCALSHTAPCVFPLARAFRRSLLRRCWKKT
jgi:hypothetical protein